MTRVDGLILAGFNPRTHEGCDLLHTQSEYNSQVSIHAPTRGATIIVVSVLVGHRVSIHAPTRGATC